ncbi:MULTISPECIES: hypothetical protein [Nonomuraea]|uniref:GDT1 family protein n=1 Tax=Nonomuraea ferruginea TaxID=46174 RepID=A0ABT4T1U3_9ACTN|nr:MULTISPECIES: hypothetical protein [Nonomuraea]MDA0643016.1 hypothetical protein [Nonomuraea ferruginea]TXK39875.1 hypothetical protein FR742_09990 [Nonomuraea sp. C10]
MVGGTVIALLAAVVAEGLGSVLPLRWREVAAGTLLVGVGVADVLNRTPHVMRQVPQDYARALRPGWRGVLWGVDLGLLFTTQKTTSLIWGALVVTVLLNPMAAPVFLVGMVIGSVAGTVIGTALNHVPGRAFLGGERVFIRTVRALSGVVLICLGLLQIV